MAHLYYNTVMSSELKQKAWAIFDAALEIKEPGLRQSFLEEACQGNLELRALIDRLLASQPKAEEFFQTLDVAHLLKDAISPPPDQPRCDR